MRTTNILKNYETLIQQFIDVPKIGDNEPDLSKIFSKDMYLEKLAKATEEMQIYTLSPLTSACTALSIITSFETDSELLQGIYNFFADLIGAETYAASN